MARRVVHFRHMTDPDHKTMCGRTYTGRYLLTGIPDEVSCPVCRQRLVRRGLVRPIIRETYDVDMPARMPARTSTRTSTDKPESEIDDYLYRLGILKREDE